MTGPVRAGGQNALQHLVARAEGVHASILHDPHDVYGGNGARPVRDDDGDPLPFTDMTDGLRHRRLAFGIQIGIGLVEDHEKGIAKQGLARATRWRWPPDSVMPPSPIFVS